MLLQPAKGTNDDGDGHQSAHDGQSTSRLAKGACTGAWLIPPETCDLIYASFLASGGGTSAIGD